MKLSDELLDSLIVNTEEKFKNYIRKPYLSKEDIIYETKILFDNQKEVIWLENLNEIGSILKNCNNPWVYHYTLNLNWVLFFTTLYEEYLFPSVNLETDEQLEIGGIYLKAQRLKLIFNHADGIIEEEDKVYIIKSDYNLIQKGLGRFTLS